MNKKIFFVVGAGPGIGNHVAEKFGKEGFHVILMARNAGKLEQYLAEFTAKNISASAISVDASDENSLKAAFEQVKNQYKKVDALLYNVASLQQTRADKLSTSELVDAFKLDVSNALYSVQQVLPEQLSTGEGTILFTGGGFATYPSGEYTTVSMNKAALKNLAFALAENLYDRGVYVGMVTVVGNVEPNTHFSPKLIAEKFWELSVKREDIEFVYR